jgi:Rieske 2Fe-2S family protein
MVTYHKTADTFKTGSMTLPQKYYTSDEVFEREQERIFSKYWVCAGHQSRIPNPGDYFLLNLFNESLIILRDKENQIRAFFNVCRHRGTRICEAAEGQFSNSIQCTYHAWTYGLDGKLIGAPFMKEVEIFAGKIIRCGPRRLKPGKALSLCTLDSMSPNLLLKPTRR